MKRHRNRTLVREHVMADPNGTRELTVVRVARIRRPGCVDPDGRQRPLLLSDLPLAMTCMACAATAGVVLFLSGCAPQLVELPIDRQPAAVVQLGQGPLRCPADTVTLDDESEASGAGALPADFDGRNVLLCMVDYTRSQSLGGKTRVAVEQWRAVFTPELRAALELPDRELQPEVACADAIGSSTAVYLVDTQRRAVRVLLPSDDPCSRIRPEVSALLPPTDQPADATFTTTREFR